MKKAKKSTKTESTLWLTLNNEQANTLVHESYLTTDRGNDDFRLSHFTRELAGQILSILVQIDQIEVEVAESMLNRVLTNERVYSCVRCSDPTRRRRRKAKGIFTDVRTTWRGILKLPRR
jgi:hypothetical protein